MKCTMLDPLDWRVSVPAVGRFYYGVEIMSDIGSSRILCTLLYHNISCPSLAVELEAVEIPLPSTLWVYTV